MGTEKIAAKINFDLSKRLKVETLAVKINKKDTVLETRNSETWLGQAG